MHRPRSFKLCASPSLIAHVCACFFDLTKAHTWVPCVFWRTYLPRLPIGAKSQACDCGREDQGVGNAEDIDKGMKLGTAHKMGPLHLADFIGALAPRALFLGL